MDESYTSRFSGIGRVFGTSALQQLHNARVMVIGLGGVGSWTVEALARSGIGALTLVDFDDVCVSNTNRQILALDSTRGKFKAEVLRDRVKDINPKCEVEAMVQFFTPKTADQVFARNEHVIVDAIDDVHNKALLICEAVRRGRKIVTTGGIGGKRWLSSVVVTEFAKSGSDSLLSAVRKRLRKHHGFTLDAKYDGATAVSLVGPTFYSRMDGTVATHGDPRDRGRINCNNGFGALAYIAGTLGFAAAMVAVEEIFGEFSFTDGRPVRRSEAPGPIGNSPTTVVPLRVDTIPK